MAGNNNKAAIRIFAIFSGLVLAVCCVALLLDNGYSGTKNQTTLEQESLFVYGLPHPKVDNPIAEAVSRFEKEYTAYLHGQSGSKLAQALEHAKMAEPVALQEGNQHTSIPANRAVEDGGDGLLRVLLGKASARIVDKYERQTEDKDKVLSTLSDVEHLLLQPESEDTAMQRVLKEIEDREQVLLAEVP
jgi:hypothetical protein